MKTEIIKIDPKNPDIEKIKHAASILRYGGIVAFPTETVYGLGVNIADKDAIKRLYALKQRPNHKPSSIHIANISDVEKYAPVLSKGICKLMYFLWPGPLTLILNTKDNHVIGVRCPKDLIARHLLYYANVGVIAPSANLADEPPACTGAEVIERFDSKIDVIIDSGRVELGISSTIVDVSGKKTGIIRQGAIPEEAVSKVLNKKVILFVCTGNTCRSPMAEALFNSMADVDKMQAVSCGIAALDNGLVAENAIDALKEQSIDGSGLRSQQIRPYMIEMADIILTMADKHKQEIIRLVPGAENKTFLLKGYGRQEDSRDLSVADPVGQDIEVYRSCCDELRQEIERILDYLKENQI